MNQLDTTIFNNAVALAGAGNKVAAYAELQTVYKSNPKNVNLLLWLAFTTPDLAEAEANITLAESLEPENNSLTGAKEWLAQEKAKQPPPFIGLETKTSSQKASTAINNYKKPAFKSPPDYSYEPNTIQPYNNYSQNNIISNQPKEDYYLEDEQVCHNCRKDDQFQKATAIWSSGVSITNTSGYYYGTHNNFGGISSSSVSSSLLANKLQPPQPPVKNHFLSFCLMIISLPFFFAGPGGIFFGFCIVALAVWLIVKKIIAYDENMPEYNKAYNLWDRSYYCYRCDYVTII